MKYLAGEAPEQLLSAPRTAGERTLAFSWNQRGGSSVLPGHAGKSCAHSLGLVAGMKQGIIFTSVLS